MDKQKQLSEIRNRLIRLEDTILFALIERAQFLCNGVIYGGETASLKTGGRCLLDYILYETEKAHARVGRYIGQIEVPYFMDLPGPALFIPKPDEFPLRANTVNLNVRLRTVYVDEVLPFICAPGEDGHYWESCVADVNCLQALSRRIHYGKVVAEIKYLANKETFDRLIAESNVQGVMELITDRNVEKMVVERIRIKANHYGQDPMHQNPAEHGKINTEAAVYAYHRWVIPLTKEVEVQYLFQCNDEIGTRTDL